MGVTNRITTENNRPQTINIYSREPLLECVYIQNGITFLSADFVFSTHLIWCVCEFRCGFYGIRVVYVIELHRSKRQHCLPMQFFFGVPEKGLSDKGPIEIEIRV